MNKITTVLLCLSIVHLGFGLTPAERQELVKKRIEKEGGLLTIAPTGNVLRIVNAQKSLPSSAFTPLIADMRKIGIDIQVEVSDATPLIGKDPIALARSAMLTPKTGAVLAFVEAKDFPTIISAPENSFAVVNLHNLKVDKPSEERLNERLRKEFWRGLGFTLGAANSMMGGCVMQPVTSLSDLDRMKSRRFGSDAAIRVIHSLPAYGIEKFERMSYADACEAGIAPAPTNDLQKAIWEKVHTPPTNPLKIEFDPATQKGKVTK